MIQAILWDNDGVLVDTEGLYFQAGQEVLERQGVELTQENFIEQSLKMGKSVFDFLPDQNQELIDRLRVERNARGRAHFDIIHAQTDLLRFFEFVLAREDYDKSKPHPDAYLKAMRLHGWTPDDCVVVEDSERGCAAAVAAGLRVLVVPNDLSKHGDFSPAYKVLGHVREVVDEVERL